VESAREFFGVFSQVAQNALITFKERQMKISHVAGTDLRDDDAALVKAIEKKAFPGGGNKMVIGVRNESGAIYRKIEAVGLAEFMGVIGCFETLKFTDELEDSGSMKDGCDAIFSKK
jgi:hypothetical protein